ncbi:MAG: two-component regulator propeller domain-containing protein [Candidatus Aegiribacteria sp.]
MNLLMIFSVILTGRISEWDHYTHFGGVSDILVEDSSVTAATTGGVAFGTLGSGSVTWDSTWTCPGNLSHSDARCLARDSAGDLWVGTNGGGIDVFTAEGGFQHFGQLEGLPISLQISCILPDTTVWAGSTEGLCSMDLGYFNIWTVFSTQGGLPSDIINCVAKADSGLLVGTANGLVMLRAGEPPGQEASWQTFHSMENLIIQDVLVLETGAWAATTDGLYYTEGDSVWKKDLSYPGDSPISLAWLDGSLAVGGKGNMAILKDSEWTISYAGLGGQVVQDVHWLTNDLMVIGQHSDLAVNRAAGAGVGVGYAGSWSSSRPQGAPSNDLLSVAVDSRNDVWVTTNSRGAAVLCESGWVDFFEELPSRNQLFACAADRSGGVFLAPWHFGVTWLDWKGTPDRSDDEVITFNASNSEMLNDQVREIAVSSSGDVWFAGEAYWATPSEPSGVSRLSWDPGQFETSSWSTFEPSDGLPSGSVRSVETTTSPRKAWMGTQEGLVLGDIQSGMVTDQYSSSSGLPSSDVQSLALSRDGRLFVGTSSGLAVIDLQTGNVSEFTEVTGSVDMLDFDNLSALWAAGSNGLFRILPDGSTENYTTMNSPLQSLDIRHAAADEDNGYIYLATDHGLWRLHLEQGMSGSLGSATVYPNPFTPGEGRVMGVAGLPSEAFDIQLFDLTGVLVYESLARYRDDFAWDGTDLDGGTVASGTYIVRITQGGADRYVKLAIVR